MHLRNPRFLLLFSLLSGCGFLIFCPKAFSQIRAGLSLGLMIQPSSQYYLRQNGAYVEIASAKNGFIGQFYFIERPKFKSLGFSDYENLYFLNFGTELVNFWRLRLNTYVGAGAVIGYVESSTKQSHYQVYGFNTAFSVVLRAYFLWSFQFQTLNTWDTPDHLRAYVIWPFNTVSLGCGLEI